jgi:GAF domain-containing protein
MTDYIVLQQSMRALVSGVPHRIANLANASALLYQELPQLNWAGFYLLEGDALVLGPFQGKPACIRIPMGKGVCGTAAVRGETIIVPNVHEFPGHIACDGASNSEIVLPIYLDGAIFGVLDIDSPIFDRFDENDRVGLEGIVEILSDALRA